MNVCPSGQRVEEVDRPETGRAWKPSLSKEFRPLLIVLARYGVLPEVVRCSVSVPDIPDRGERVVIQTHRGLELATVLDAVQPSPEPGVEPVQPASEVVRRATPDDLERSRGLTLRAQVEFSSWEQRIAEWGLDLQLIDLEWTIDESKLILYVLNERGPECTKLALQAAAKGLGVVEVQPVSADGLVTVPTGGGGGGGCGSCGSH